MRWLQSIGTCFAAIGSSYLGVWSLGQLVTGSLSDHIGRKPLITGGLWVTAIGIALLALRSSQPFWILSAATMGIGTAMVCPTFLAAMSDLAHPTWRASALGVYRLWRDSGYAVGAVVAGILSDLFTIQIAILIIAIPTFISGSVTALLLPETVPGTDAAHTATDIPEIAA